MSFSRNMHFGLPPSPDWNQLVRLSRFAGFALDVVLLRVLQAAVICGGILCLFTWSGPREEQTLRRFDQDASEFKLALHAQLSQVRKQEPSAQSLRHREALLSWLERQADLSLRVRLYEENSGFPSQLLFDSLPETTAPSGPVWTRGISHRLVVGGRMYTAELSPREAERADSGNNFAALALLVMVMSLALLLPFVLPPLVVSISDMVMGAKRPSLSTR